jgi:universal stress protein A
MPRQFKTILWPTDFSEESYRALEYAERFVRETDGTLLLAHLIHVSSGELLQKDGHVLTFEEGKQRARARLAEVRDTRLHGYPKCEVLVEFGAPGEAVLDIGRQRKVDLIVISTHGESSFEHIMVGSVAEAIIRHAPCPVFVVRRGAE